jgi:hypothetical protein
MSRKLLRIPQMRDGIKSNHHRAPGFLIEHDLVGKPVPARACFSDHAAAIETKLAPK